MFFCYLLTSYKLALLQVNDPPVRNSQEAFMMEMRAARMVRPQLCYFLSFFTSIFFMGFVHLSSKCYYEVKFVCQYHRTIGVVDRVIISGSTFLATLIRYS
jgi:hypothetical protein